MQVAGHVGKGEVGVPVHRDIGRISILAHADGARIKDRIMGHLVWRAFGADQTCTVSTHSLSSSLWSGCVSNPAVNGIASALIHSYPAEEAIGRRGCEGPVACICYVAV